MCDKAILENGGTLKPVPDCYKSQGMCNKAIDGYPHELEFVPECHKDEKISEKSINTYTSTIKFVSECFVTQKCLMKQLIDVSLYLILFLINIKLKKCVTELFLKILF